MSHPGIVGNDGSPGSVKVTRSPSLKNPGITRTIGFDFAHASASSIDVRCASWRIVVHVGGGSRSSRRSNRAIASRGESQSSAVVSLSSCFGVCPSGMRARKKRVS